MKSIVWAGVGSLALASAAWAGTPVAAGAPAGGIETVQYYGGGGYRRDYDYYREPNDSGYRRRQPYYERDGGYSPPTYYREYRRRRDYDHDDY